MSEDMWGYVFESGKVVKKRLPIPKIRPNDVLVKIDSVSICGSDFHLFNNDDWAQETVEDGVTIGHEGCGTIVEVGSDVTNLKVGDFVAMESHYASPACEACGKTSDDCKEYGILGFHGAGGHTTGGVFAEYAAIPHYSCYKMSKTIRNDLQCSLLEPSGNGWEIMRWLRNNGLPKTMVVHGCGPHALNVQLFARYMGVETIVAFEIDQYRLEFAKTFGAAHHVFDPREKPDLSTIVPEGFDCAIDMVGNINVVDAMKEEVQDGGLMILFGLPSHEHIVADGENFADIIFGLEEHTLHHGGKTLRLKGLTGRTHQTWEELIAALEESEYLRNKLGEPLEVIGTLHKLEEFLKNRPKEFMKIGMTAFD